MHDVEILRTLYGQLRHFQQIHWQQVTLCALLHECRASCLSRPFLFHLVIAGRVLQRQLCSTLLWSHLFENTQTTDVLACRLRNNVDHVCRVCCDVTRRNTFPRYDSQLHPDEFFTLLSLPVIQINPTHNGKLSSSFPHATTSHIFVSSFVIPRDASSVVQLGIAILYFLFSRLLECSLWVFLVRVCWQLSLLYVNPWPAPSAVLT